MLAVRLCHSFLFSFGTEIPKNKLINNIINVNMISICIQIITHKIIANVGCSYFLFHSFNRQHFIHAHLFNFQQQTRNGNKKFSWISSEIAWKRDTNIIIWLVIWVWMNYCSRSAVAVCITFICISTYVSNWGSPVTTQSGQSSQFLF